MKLYSHLGLCAVGWLTFFGTFILLAVLVLNGVEYSIVFASLVCAVIGLWDESFHRKTKWHGR